MTSSSLTLGLGLTALALISTSTAGCSQLRGLTSTPTAASDQTAASGSSTARGVDCDKVPVGAPIETLNEVDQKLAVKDYWTADLREWASQIERLDRVAATRAYINDAPKRLGAMWCAKGSQYTDGRTPHERAFVSMKSEFAEFDAWLKREGEPQAHARLVEQRARIDELLAEYLSVPTLKKPEKNHIEDSTSDVNQIALGPLTYYARLIQVVNGAGSAKSAAAEAAVTSAKDAIAKTIGDIEKMLADSYRLPKESYAGAGLEESRNLVRTAAVAYFQKKDPKRLVAIVLTSGWRRDTGAAWVGDNLVAYDQSFIDALVVFDTDGKDAEVWAVRPRKDHKDGDRIKLDVYVPLQEATMRLANLKR